MYTEQHTLGSANALATAEEFVKWNSVYSGGEQPVGVRKGSLAETRALNTLRSFFRPCRSLLMLAVGSPWKVSVFC